MNLEQAIHQHWADTAALETLLPAERVTTGRSCGGVKPYAVIQRTRSHPALPTNLGDAMEEVVLRVNVWHDDYETARAIVEQVHVALDRATLTLDGGQVARIRRTADSVKQHDDGVWQWTVELEATSVVKS